MGMMGDNKKGKVSMILGEAYSEMDKHEKKEGEAPKMVDALFEAMQAGDKEEFQRVFDSMVQAAYYRMKSKE